jgi:secreted Zn-dependent insulinase-like peptidase
MLMLTRCQTKREYNNFFLNQPYEHARYMQSQLLSLQKWHMEEYLEVIDPLTLDQLKAFATALFSQMRLTLFVSIRTAHVCACSVRTALVLTVCNRAL